MKKINLPIDAFRDEILMCIKNNPVSIIVAETGAGKSTRVPQFLLESTNYQVVVTQPRRVAAKAVAKRVAEEMNCLFGGLVGFRTAVDRKDSSETRCLFATDGLQLVRELTNTGQSMGKGICLVIDEVHEWNLNIETLVAWAKRHVISGADIKVVLMSATLDHERLSEFFDNAPVVQVPGRCFPVLGSPNHVDGICQVSTGRMIEEIEQLVVEGANQLVFLPGKGEIRQIENTLKQLNLNAVILSLHGDVDKKEQDLVFESFSQPKVVLATNIAQTSLTIPDIDAVVDSGLERRIELVNNVETLLLSNISRADVSQRAGRAGRVKEGRYVLCNDTAFEYFSDFPTPEIQRSLLDQMVLRLAGAGLNALDLPFYHQPERETLVEAKELLFAIEALDKNGDITKLGRDVNRFPINVTSARMILEALERKCLAPVLSIVSILGTRYGTVRRRKRDNDPEDWRSFEDLLDPKKKYKSDLLVEYDLFKMARAVPNKKLLPASGIDAKSFEMALEIREQIKSAIYNLGYHKKDYGINETREDEEEILKCIASGMLVHLYRHVGGGEYQNGENRILNRDSILHKLSYYPEWIVGEPFNISFKNRRGYQQTMMLIKSCTEVNPLWFLDIAPHMISENLERMRFDDNLMSITEERVISFNGVEISRQTVESVYNGESENIERIASKLFYFRGDNELSLINKENYNTLEKYRKVFEKSGNTIKKIDDNFIINHYGEILLKAFYGGKELKLSLSEIDRVIGGFDKFLVPFNSLISEEEAREINLKNPDMVEVKGKCFQVQYCGDYEYIEIENEMVLEIEVEDLVIPSKRTLKVKCKNNNNYYVESLAAAKLRVSEKILRDFKVGIGELLIVPQEAPWQKNYWSWSWTLNGVGKSLEKAFKEIEDEVIKNFNNNRLSPEELILGVKIKVDEIKNDLMLQYHDSEDLLSIIQGQLENFSGDPEKVLIEEEIYELRKEISTLNSFFFEEGVEGVKDKAFILKNEVSDLGVLLDNRKKEKEKLLGNGEIPEYLLDAFCGSIKTTLKFISNVKNLPSEKLDGHIIGNCGRNRVQEHLEELGGKDFFCGADPNDVKYYVYEYHFRSYSEVETEEDCDISSNNPMAEALRKAGLL